MWGEKPLDNECIRWKEDSLPLSVKCDVEDNDDDDDDYDDDEEEDEDIDVE
eukprot:COSAG05_NODE_1557_length_4564_cov_116.713102_3_plen_51_part_00